jgi:hypothetical protein
MQSDENHFNGPAYSQAEVRGFGRHIEKHLEYWAGDAPCPGLGRKIKRWRGKDGLWHYPKADVDRILAFRRPLERFTDLAGMEWVETKVAASLLNYNRLSLHRWKPRRGRKKGKCPWGPAPESTTVPTYNPDNTRGFIELTYWKLDDLKKIVARREARKSRYEGRMSVEEARRRLRAKSRSSVFRVTQLPQACLADQEHPGGRPVDCEILDQPSRKGGRKLLLSAADIEVLARHRESLRRARRPKNGDAKRRRRRQPHFPAGADLTTAEAAEFLGVNKSLLFYWHEAVGRCTYLPDRAPLRKGAPRQGLTGAPSDTWNREDLETIRRNRGVRFDGKCLIDGQLFRTARNAEEEYGLPQASLARWERQGYCPYLPGRRRVEAEDYTPTQRGRIPGKSVRVYLDSDLQSIKAEMENRQRMRNPQPQELSGGQTVRGAAGRRDRPFRE